MGKVSKVGRVVTQHSQCRTAGHEQRARRAVQLAGEPCPTVLKTSEKAPMSLIELCGVCMPIGQTTNSSRKHKHKRTKV